MQQAQGVVPTRQSVQRLTDSSRQSPVPTVLTMDGSCVGEDFDEDMRECIAAYEESSLRCASPSGSLQMRPPTSSRARFVRQTNSLRDSWGSGPHGDPAGGAGEHVMAGGPGVLGGGWGGPGGWASSLGGLLGPARGGSHPGHAGRGAAFPEAAGPGRGLGHAGGGREAGCGPACGADDAAACGGCASSYGGTSQYVYGVVGQNQGEFRMVPTYQYVGAGAGNVALVAVPGRGCSCCWALCFLWLLAIPLLFASTTTTTTTSTTTPTAPSVAPPEPPPDTTPPPTPSPERGSCRIFGDPHVMTFDGSRASFYSSGEYWVVRSSSVWMQGRYLPTPVTNGLAVMKEIAFGGPFLQGEDGSDNILRISAVTATWNGKAIIQDFPDAWKNEDPRVEISTDEDGEILQPAREGQNQLHVVHVKLPLNIEVQINRWNEPTEGDYINAQITMSPQPGQDGHCGNFNGDPQDDTRPLIRARVGTAGVDLEDLLFKTKTPVRQPNRPDLNDCPTEKAHSARELCAAKSKTHMASQDCMIDVCFGGDRFAEMTDYE